MGQDPSLPVIGETRDKLIVDGRDLNALPYLIPEDHKIKTIRAANNKLNTFLLKQNFVEQIDVSNNSLGPIIEKNPELVFDFPRLKLLKMSECELKEFPESIAKLSTIKELHMDRNYLETITLNFPELEGLDLFINCLTKLPELPQSLLKLNVGFNQLQSLDFSLTNLTELKLAGNTITYVSDSICFPNLKFLDLSHNHIYEMPSISKLAPKVELIQMTFNFLTVHLTDLPVSVQKLDVSHNCIEHWPESLSNLTNMILLDISNNLLEELPELPPSLKTLLTEHNKFKQVYPIKNDLIRNFNFIDSELEALPDISNTKPKGIVFQRNKIKSLDNINYLPRTAKSLDFSSNLLTSINPDLFKLKRVEVLVLTCNNITEIPADIVKSQIKCLMISENPLSTLPPLPPSLTTISCAGCKFTEIPQAVCDIKTLVHVDFSCNEITQCRPISTQLLNLSCNKLIELPTLSEPLVTLLCAHNKIKEAKIPSIPGIINIDISHNEIKTFSIASNPTLKILKLSGNPIKMEFDFTVVPHIDFLDIVNTSIKIRPDCTHRFTELAQDQTRDYERVGDISAKYFQVRKDTGYFEFIGVRPTMEDALIIRDVKDGRLVGVLDGHAGSKAATIGAFFIPNFFLKHPDERGLNCIQEVLRQLNEKIKRMDLKDGATMALARIGRNEISVAHLGDARAVIVRKDGSVLELTVDHKATDRMEFDLLKEKRSFLAFGRVNGTLAVSRTIGDLGLSGVLRTATLTSYQPTPDDCALLLACDGVFDVMTSTDVGRVVASESDPARAAAKVVCLSFARGSQDNISVLVVSLEQQKSILKKFSFFK